MQLAVEMSFFLEDTNDVHPCCIRSAAIPPVSSFRIYRGVLRIRTYAHYLIGILRMPHRLGEAEEANLGPEDVEKVLREMRTFCCAEL